MSQFPATTSESCGKISASPHPCQDCAKEIKGKRTGNRRDIFRVPRVTGDPSVFSLCLFPSSYCSCLWISCPVSYKLSPLTLQIQSDGPCGNIKSFYPQRTKNIWGMVTHACSLSTQKVRKGGSLHFKEQGMHREVNTSLAVKRYPVWKTQNIKINR